MPLDIQRSVAATFAAHLHSVFRLRDQPTAIELALIEVVDGSTSGQVSFSLLFRGPQQPPLAQQIFPFEHDRRIRSLHRAGQAGRAGALLRSHRQPDERAPARSE
jgi:hypothetical protein